MINNTSTILIIVLTAIVLALASYVYYMLNETPTLNLMIDREKLKNEAILSEKHSIEKLLMRRLSSLKVSQANMSARLSRRCRQVSALYGMHIAATLINVHITDSLQDIAIAPQRQAIMLTYLSWAQHRRYTFTFLNDGNQVGNVHVNFY